MGPDVGADPGVEYSVMIITPADFKAHGQSCHMIPMVLSVLSCPYDKIILTNATQRRNLSFGSQCKVAVQNSGEVKAART